MRINILQHTPNEKAGSILEWAKLHHHDVYTYHPYQVGKLPKDNDTDMLVILGGPMSTVLHWHEDMFEIPPKAQLLFSSDHVKNQGYLYQKNVIGLQFHFEPLDNNVKEIVVNDYPYINGSVLNQNKEQMVQY